MDKINWAAVDAIAINFALLGELVILAKWSWGFLT
jgi:hypothetical protein